MKPDFTESQIKALLIAASAADERPMRPYFDQVERAVDERTSLDDLRRLKEQAKALAADAPDVQHRESAQLLYHVAVASAFVRHATEISGRPMHKQAHIYERFADAWSGHAVGKLFREAAARIAGKKPNE
jgi:hypothetical protein